jgi:4'-phosphopantetheinyl transferase
MLWLDGFHTADSLPAAWLIATGETPHGRRERSRLRHATTRVVLAAQLGIEPADIELANDASGRLRAVGPGENVLHASHATRDGLVLVAMGEARIGADIERVGGEIPFGALHRAEQLWLHQLDEADRTIAFARLWAAKEAHGKWAGTGIPETDRHAALPLDGGQFQVAGFAHVRIVTRLVERNGQSYAMAVATD